MLKQMYDEAGLAAQGVPLDQFARHLRHMDRESAANFTAMMRQQLEAKGWSESKRNSRGQSIAAATLEPPFVDAMSRDFARAFAAAPSFKAAWDGLIHCHFYRIHVETLVPVDPAKSGTEIVRAHGDDLRVTFRLHPEGPQLNEWNLFRFPGETKTDFLARCDREIAEERRKMEDHRFEEFVSETHLGQAMLSDPLLSAEMELYRRIRLPVQELN